MSAINIFGGDDAFNALIYKPPTETFINYLKSGINSAISVTNNFTDSFRNNLDLMFNKFYSDDAIYNAKAVLFNAGYHLSEDVIYTVKLNSWTPNLIMQQYIMAHPEVNKLYNKQMLDGFSETYVDTEPFNKGTDRSHYQAVMDGVLQYDSDGNGYVCHYSLGDEVIEKDLSVFDKLSVLDTWVSVEKLLAEDTDPTDLTNF